MDSEPGIQREKPASLHVRFFDTVHTELSKSTNGAEREAGNAIFGALHNEDRLLSVVKDPAVKSVLFGQGENIYQGTIGKMLRTRSFQSDVLAVVMPFVESTLPKSRMNAVAGSDVIKYLAELLADKSSSETKVLLENMSRGIRFFDRWATAISPNKSNAPSSNHEMHLRGAFGEAFSMLMLRRDLPGFEVKASDNDQDMKGIDIVMEGQGNGLNGACSVKVKSGLSNYGVVDMAWTDRFGQTRKGVAPINQFAINGAPIYWGGMMVNYSRSDTPEVRMLGGRPTGAVADRELTHYLNTSASTFFDNNDPRRSGASDLNPRYDSQVLLMLDFSKALARAPLQSLAPMVCQRLRTPATSAA